MRKLIGLLAWSLMLSVMAGEAPAWRELTPKLKAAKARIGRGGMVLDRKTGALYTLGRGVYRSNDQGETWTAIDDDRVVGKYWYCHALQIDPNGGGRLAVFLKDPRDAKVVSGMTLDDGRTWQPITRVMQKKDLHSYGWSWGLVDWTAKEPKFMLARMHHSSRMWRSEDAGATWEELPMSTVYMGFFDPENLVAWNKRKKTTFHSADHGKTWQETGNWPVSACIPVRVEDKLYWLVEDGLIVSEDGGKTWTQQVNGLKKAQWGPIFGATERDMIIMTMDSVMLSNDAGKTWTAVADNLAAEQYREKIKKKKYSMTWFVGETAWAWDFRNGRLYMSRPGKLYVHKIPDTEELAR